MFGSVHTRLADVTPSASRRQSVQAPTVMSYSARLGKALGLPLVAVARWCRTRYAIQRVAQLDNRMLRDIGIDRSEMESVVRHGRPR
jgi:uncharacterized protein YjiS (DUF1127 family)